MTISQSVTYQIKLTRSEVLVVSSENDKDGWPVIVWSGPKGKRSLETARIVKRDLLMVANAQE